MIKMIGIVLIVLGILALVYQGFTYTKTKQDAQIGPITMQHNETQSVPFPPIVGGVLIAAGIAAMFIRSSKA